MNESGLHRMVSLIARGVLAFWIVAVIPAGAVRSGLGIADPPADDSPALTAVMSLFSQEATDLETQPQTVLEGTLSTSAAIAATPSLHAHPGTIARRPAPLSLLLVAIQSTSTSL